MAFPVGALYKGANCVAFESDSWVAVHVISVVAAGVAVYPELPTPDAKCALLMSLFVDSSFA